MTTPRDSSSSLKSARYGTLHSRDRSPSGLPSWGWACGRTRRGCRWSPARCIAPLRRTWAVWVWTGGRRVRVRESDDGALPGEQGRPHTWDQLPPSPGPFCLTPSSLRAVAPIGPPGPPYHETYGTAFPAYSIYCCTGCQVSPWSAAWALNVRPQPAHLHAAF